MCCLWQIIPFSCIYVSGKSEICKYRDRYISAMRQKTIVTNNTIKCVSFDIDCFLKGQLSLDPDQFLCIVGILE